MRKILYAIIVIGICAGLIAACGPIETPQPAQEPAVEDRPTQGPTQEPTDELAHAPEEPEEDDRTEEILTFLAVLGMGADTTYENPDWFDKDLLVSVPGVDAVQFDVIDQKLKDDGFTHPQDPEYIEETTMRHCQYSGEALFIDATYIEKDEYLTVLFSPLE